MRGLRRVALTLLLASAGAALAQEEGASTAQLASVVPPLTPEHKAALERLEASVTVELRRLEQVEVARYRRRDGTLDWPRLMREGALSPRPGEAAPHLPLGLFLRELARAVATEDRARIEELFQATASTDLYERHGLINLGGRSTAVPFAPRLRRFLGPAFVRQLLRDQTALATAHLIPELARGRLDRRTFAISLAGLGLSSKTVRDELAAQPWVASIGGFRLVRNLGLLSSLGKLSTLRGFIYVVGETIVSVYFADEVEAWTNSLRDRAASRRAIGAANLELCLLAGQRGVDPARLAKALDAWDLAWARWRDHLLAPALAEEARLAEQLAPLARRALELEDARTALVVRLPDTPHLHADLVARHGSVEAWWAAQTGQEEGELRAEVERLLGAHSARVAARIAEAYAPVEGERRPFPRLSRELLAAATARDPAFGRVSESRPATYQDQRELLAALEAALIARYGEATPLRAALEDARALVERSAALDRALVAPAPRGGLAGALDGR